MILNRDILIGIAIAVLIATAVGGFNYWKKYQEKKLDEVAELVYLYEKGELKREDVEQKIKGTPYYAYFLAITGAEPSEVVKHLEDDDLRKLFVEKDAFGVYSEKKYEEALKELSQINEEDFNYPSALMLRAFVYEDRGEKKQALSLYEELVKDYPNSYFARIAKARSLMLGKD